MKIEDLKIGDHVVVEYGAVTEHAKVKELTDTVILQLSDNSLKEFDSKQITRVFRR